MKRVPAVLCQSVSKTYGTGETAVHALRGLDLEVYSGELLMLVGPSGSGKTTLISVIAGILGYDEGVCVALERDLGALTERQLNGFRRHQVGFIFQAFNLIPMLTAAENVAVPLLIQGVPFKKAIQSAQELLNEVGIGNKGRRFPSELSGGEQQRVAIARALIHEPTLIVCDEPTSALDHETGGHIMETLRDIARNEKRALIVVTHDARIFPYADRIVRMDDGRIVEVNHNGS